MSVVPFIEPLISADPADVVTVQSDVCANGLESTALTQTCVARMRELEIVAGRELTPVVDTSITPIFFPVKLNSSDIVFIYVPFYGATHPSDANNVVTDESISVSVLSALPLIS